MRSLLDLVPAGLDFGSRASKKGSDRTQIDAHFIRREIYRPGETGFEISTRCRPSAGSISGTRDACTHHRHPHYRDYRFAREPRASRSDFISGDTERPKRRVLTVTKNPISGLNLESESSPRANRKQGSNPGPVYPNHLPPLPAGQPCNSPTGPIAWRTLARSRGVDTFHVISRNIA